MVPGVFEYNIHKSLVGMLISVLESLYEDCYNTDDVILWCIMGVNTKNSLSCHRIVMVITNSPLIVTRATHAVDFGAKMQ